MDCKALIDNYVAGLGEKFACQVLGDRLQIITPYTYPDNDLISVFVLDSGDGRVSVTDLGETIRHLDSQGFDTSARRRQYVIEQIAHKARVTLSRGRLIREGNLSDFSELMLDVISASKGVADMIYSARTYEPASFKEEVADWMKEACLAVETGVRETGESQSQYTVEFRISVGSHKILAQTISPPDSGNVRAKVNAVFRQWSDISAKRPKVTILNDVDYSWRDEDRRVLEMKSLVAGWKERGSVESTIASAPERWAARAS